MSPSLISPKLFIDSLLSKPSIKIRDVEGVLRKLSALTQGGPNSLQVVTDFDQTITKHHHNGDVCCNTFNVFIRSPHCPPEFKAECEISAKKYSRIEVDEAMKVEDRIPFVLAWQNDFLSSLIKLKISRSLIKKIAIESNIRLRDNAKTVLTNLNAANIPVLVFSAGVGDILLEILNKYEAIFPNMRIVSNEFDFDEGGFLRGFKPPPILSFNKNFGSLSKTGGNENYFEELSQRHNVILMGDNIGDVHMADGIKVEGNTILKIGFLEAKLETKLETYMSQYDIVILDDQTWDLCNALLQNVVGLDNFIKGNVYSKASQ